MPAIEKPALEIRNLSRRFGSFDALKNISLSVQPGATLAIFGHNGAGKTTLLKILATVMKPSSGEVFVNGYNLAKRPLEVRRQLGVISHKSYLYLSLTAYDNLAFYSRLYDVPDFQRRIKELLGQFGLKTRMYDKVSTFSRGMLQRVAIARALLHRPPVVLMDEPESGLDNKALETLWLLLKQESRTVIFTHHNLERGYNAASQVAILAQGSLYYYPQQGCTLAELQHAYTQSLEGA